jgi:bacteriocin biosynthesis cyclodehydratase domain-containing protein
MTKAPQAVRLRLHPDASFARIDAGRLQLRVPDGNHLTFESEADELERMLEILKVGVTPLELLRLTEKELAAELVALLENRGLICRANWETQFVRLLDQHISAGGRVADYRLPSSVTIEGEGRIASLLRTNLSHHAPASTPDKRETLLLVVADFDDVDMFREANARAVGAEQAVSFVRWDQRRLLLGPFVVPGQTACLECALHRQRAACLHIDELDTWRRMSKSHPRYEGGQVLDGLVAAVADRHVTAIRRGAWEVAGPGVVSLFDPVSFEHTRAPVIRLPRCEVCRPQHLRPHRAIRDLN